MKRTNFIRSLFYTAIIYLLSNTAFATMKCGVHIITGGKSPGDTKYEVEKKCGTPYSKSGNNWLYVKGNVIYRLRFGENSGLKTISKEIAR